MSLLQASDKFNTQPGDAIDESFWRVFERQPQAAWSAFFDVLRYAESKASNPDRLPLPGNLKMAAIVPKPIVARACKSGEIETSQPFRRPSDRAANRWSRQVVEYSPAGLTHMKHSPVRSGDKSGRAVLANETNPRKLASEVHEPLGNWVIYAFAGEWGGPSSKLRGPKTEGERDGPTSRLVICGRSIRVSPLRSFRRLLGDPDPCRTISCL